MPIHKTYCLLNAKLFYSLLTDLRLGLLILLFLAISSQITHAQNARILDLDDFEAYTLIERLVQRGYLNELNPTRLPYYESEVYEALVDINESSLNRIEKIWYEQLKEIIGFDLYENQRPYVVEPILIGGNEVNNTERKQYYRPSDNSLHAWPYGELFLFTDFKNLTLSNNVRFDLYYEFGPDGIDPTNRLYIRNDNPYLSYRNGNIQALIGRTEHQWGMYGESSTFISDVAPPFDQLAFAMGNTKISITSITGFLDNISGDDVFRGSTRFDNQSKERMVSMRRIDWRLSDNLLLTFKDAILYSHYSLGLEPKYLVPGYLYFFLEAAAPEDQVENLFIGGSVWYRHKSLSLYFDFMVDDVIFNRADRGLTEKNNFSLVLNSDYYLRNHPVQLNLDFELVTYQAYNTDQAEGRYLYLNRGIATDYNDYAFTELRFDYFADSHIKGLTISPYVGLLLQGEQTINQEFISNYSSSGRELEYVLTGTVERTARAALELQYFGPHNTWVRADIGANFIDNKGNTASDLQQEINGMIEIGFTANFGELFR